MLWRILFFWQSSAKRKLSQRSDWSTSSKVRTVSIVLLSDHPGLKGIVEKALSSGQVVQAVPTERIASLGVNPNFTYSVIAYNNKGIELRNSWGTLEERSKISFKSEGNFELSAGQMRENISHIIVTSIHTEYSTTTIQAKHRLGFYSSHTFKVRN